MARGRLISRTLGSSRRFHQLLGVGGKLGEFCQVLFPLIVANTDDFGRMEGDAFTVKNVVFPSSPRVECNFDRALDVLAEVGLIERYAVDGVIYLQVNQFDPHQPNLHKRTSSKFPEFPGGSEKYRANIRESNLTESKGIEPRTEENPELRLERRTADALFDDFWVAYPKKKAKDDARRAWNRRRPNDALLATILAALAVQCRSPDWQKDGGQFIPYPATWLNQARWTDETDRVLSDGLSDTARYNLAASDEAEQLILSAEAHRTGTHGHRR